MANTVYSLQIVPRIPPAIAGLERLARESLVQLVAGAARAFCASRSRALAGRRSESQAVLALPASGHSRARRDRRELSRQLSTACSASSTLSRRDRRRRFDRGPRGRRPDCLFFGRVRLSRELPDLLGRPRHSRRRSLQDRERFKPAVRRDRPALPSRLLSPAYRSTRPADSRLSAYQPRGHADPRAHSRAAKRPLSNSVPERSVYACVWRADVGRVSGIAARHQHRSELARGSQDHERALRRRSALAVAAGSRARHRRRARARAVGLEPTVWHINEGHAAFLVLERARELVQRGVPFDVAREATAASTIFTTHTPVAAGHDVFPAEMVLQQFASYMRDLGIDAERSAGARQRRIGRRRVQHDQARAARRVLDQRREPNSRRRVVRRSSRARGPRSASTRIRSATSRTACTCRRSFARPGRELSTSISAATGKRELMRRGVDRARS